MYQIHLLLSLFHIKQLFSKQIESNAAYIRSVQGIFLHFDYWSWPLNGLIDLIYIIFKVETMKCILMKFTRKVYLIIKSAK